MSNKGESWHVNRETKEKAISMIHKMAKSGQYTKTEIVTAVVNKFGRSRSWVYQLNILSKYDIPKN